jgi:hypothetical protein
MKDKARFSGPVCAQAAAAQKLIPINRIAVKVWTLRAMIASCKFLVILSFLMLEP